MNSALTNTAPTTAVPLLIAIILGLPLLLTLATFALRDARRTAAINRTFSPVVPIAALLLGWNAFNAPGTEIRDGWYLVDSRSVVLLLISSVVGAISIRLSPLYLSHYKKDGAPGQRGYFAALNLFWLTLLAIPLSNNLATTLIFAAMSSCTAAILVGSSGERRSLEAGWKYLVLTSIGLMISVLGVVLLYMASGTAHSDFGLLDWNTLFASASHFPHQTALFVFLLIAAGTAAKIGWAPIHHWLPDAHGEAPPPVSAMLSAALLPTAMLILWRTGDALAPAVGQDNINKVFILFGLASLAVAIPFLWRSLPWKRLLAYSSLEQMGIAAVGIGSHSPLALYGVLLHFIAHAAIKSFGFYLTIPLLSHDPAALRRRVRGIAFAHKKLGIAMGATLFTLSGMPPGPLFFTELLILYGGMVAGQLVLVALTTVLIALGFLGLLHSLLEIVVGQPRRRARASHNARELQEAV